MFSKFKFMKIETIKTNMNINPISYDNICEIIRFELIILYFLKEKNLEQNNRIEDNLIRKINIKKLIKKLLFSIFIGKIFIINKNNKKINKGEKKNFISLIFTKKFKFLEKSLIASENGWKIPKIPTFTGPIRKWKIPKNFRSIIVKKAIEIKIINKIIIKFIKILILIINFILFYINFLKFLLILETIIILIFFLIINFINFNEILFILLFLSIIVIESSLGIFLFFEFLNSRSFFYLNNSNLF